MKAAAELAVLGGPPLFAEPLHVGRPNVPDADAVIKRIRRSLNRGWLTNDGPLVRELEAELAKYAGTFESESPPVTVSVQLMGGSLKAAMEGQPLYTLVPLSATRFQLTGPPGMPAGYFLDFKLAGDKVTSVTLVQPDPQPSLTFAPTRGK